VVEAMQLGAVDLVEKPIDPTKIPPLCEEIAQRRLLTNHATVNELLQLTELSLEQNAFRDACMYLKTAMLRDENRAEPYYWLSELCEAQGEIRQALHYYCRAIDVGPTFQSSRNALFRLKRLASAAGG
jgi:tetratricopeptide (TPR) repeat protein